MNKSSESKIAFELLQAAKELGFARTHDPNYRMPKLKLSDKERSMQGTGRPTREDGSVDPQDGIRQGPGVYSGGI